MKDADNFDDDDALETDTATVSDEKPRSKRGRPRGAKNKFSSDARALLERHAPSAIRQLCRIAAGHSVNRWPAGGGAKETLTPSVKDMLTAQIALLDRMVPVLKSTELSGPNQSPLIPQSEPLTLSATAHALHSLMREAGLRSQSAPPKRVIDGQVLGDRTGNVRFRG